MPRLLIPFAEPDGADRAVDALLREPRDDALTVHLAAVVEPLRPGKVAIFVSAERAESMVRDAAQRWLAPLEAKLAAAGVPFQSEVVLGAPRTTIRALAQRAEHRSRHVATGPHRHGPPGHSAHLRPVAASGHRCDVGEAGVRAARFFAAGLGLVAASPALAAEAGFNGGSLSPLWIVPFAGILLSIAVVPVTAPSFWHHHFGKTSAFWALAFLVPFAVYYGVDLALREVVHTLVAEYVPFIILLLALFTVSGGIHIRGNLHGSARLNTGILALGTVLASVMGTTGAAMLLIRPLLRANDNRRHRAHVVMFFIFLVANIGGALTPLGDPPLFLGFLKGVDFFWTTKVMLWPTLLASALLLALFYVVDQWFWRREDEVRPLDRDPTPDRPIRIEGKINFLFLLAIVIMVLLSGVWKSGVSS